MAKISDDAAYLARLQDYYARWRSLPAYGPLHAVLGLASRSAVAKMLGRLRAAGFLERTPAGRWTPTARFFARPCGRAESRRPRRRWTRCWPAWTRASARAGPPACACGAFAPLGTCAPLRQSGPGRAGPVAPARRGPRHGGRARNRPVRSEPGRLTTVPTGQNRTPSVAGAGVGDLIRVA